MVVLVVDGSLVLPCRRRRQCPVTLLVLRSRPVAVRLLGFLLYSFTYRSSDCLEGLPFHLFLRAFTADVCSLCILSMPPGHVCPPARLPLPSRDIRDGSFPPCLSL